MKVLESIKKCDIDINQHTVWFTLMNLRGYLGKPFFFSRNPKSIFTSLFPVIKGPSIKGATTPPHPHLPHTHSGAKCEVKSLVKFLGMRMLKVQAGLRALIVLIMPIALCHCN